MVTGVLMVTADPLIIAVADARAFWFRPVLGYAFPVLLTNLLAGACLWLWSRQGFTNRPNIPHA